jgi:photosystem II stability/assembly factor-like uncharacterized protein
MNRRLRNGISAAVCAFALAGCGGGGGGDSAATPASQAKNDTVQPPKAAAPKIADVGITPTSALRPGTKVSFIVSGIFPSATTYVWDFGDSTPLSNGVSATHTYSKVGTFSVKVTATDASGQKSTETRSVTIVQNQPPVIGGATSLGQGSTGAIALGQGSSGAVNIGQVEAIGPAVTIVVNATDPQGDSLTYKWLIDGVAYGQPTANNMLSYSFATGGSHVVTVIVANEYGGQTTQDFRVNFVSPLGPVTPEPGGYSLWKASYTAQSVGRIRVATNKTAWALPIKKAQVLRSTDNGRSWQELSLPKDEDGTDTLGFIDIGFADDKNIWVVGCPQQKYFKTENGARLDFNYAAVMHSSDGGASWENVSLGGGLEARCKKAVQFVGQNGWIVDSIGTVMNTTDGGKTWQFQADAGIDAVRMQFIDARNGWIVGAKRNESKLQISRTTDGGATWTATQIPDATAYSYASVFFVDSKTGYASGSQWSRSPNPVLKTINGGVTWSALAVPKNTFISDLAFTTPTNGYALDMFGDVYGTKDGGLNWTKIGVASSGANLALTSFALGDNTALLSTSSSSSGDNKFLLGAPSSGGGGILWLTPL